MGGRQGDRNQGLKGENWKKLLVWKTKMQGDHFSVGKKAKNPKRSSNDQHTSHWWKEVGPSQNGRPSKLSSAKPTEHSVRKAGAGAIHRLT